MQNYPYNPELLHALNALRDDFVIKTKLAIQNHTSVNINEVGVCDVQIFAFESESKTIGSCISIMHNNFLIARVLIGNHLI